ncbi:dioxygenase [Pseudorhodoplanes sp.]|uniref:dioxygenase family protein n=1 Tax=Pseudorhodoplanes sp. TaxID=1934341 RepID=UPI003D129953
MINGVADVTPAVLAAMANTPDARLREITKSFISHIHAFAREVELTEEEYEVGINFLNRIGKATSEHHNEGVLIADVIGLSTLVCLLNNGNAGATETTAALLGPFWRINAPSIRNGGSIVRSSTPGAALFVKGRVKDINGNPIANVDVDVWQASPKGLYENQDQDQADMNLRGKLVTNAEGIFEFRSVMPDGYPVPTDGPAGDLLRAQRRHPYRPAHIHFLLFKPKFKTLITQVFVNDDPYLETDAVFGVTAALIGTYRKHDSGEPPAADITAPWHTLEYDFTMEPGFAKLPTPPIK